MKQTLEEAILKTVTWWSDKSFRTPMNQNNGDDSAQGGMASMLMNMLASTSQETVTDEKIKKFEEKLTELLLDADGSYQRTLSVDYGPCSKLSEAAQFAGIELGCFPCKTTSWISDDNKASASYQYRGEHVEI